MMNISGNASSWITEEKKKKDVVDVVIERKPINIDKELKILKDLYEKLEVKHNKFSNKDIHDALIDVYSAIRVLKNIKNN